jgi:hypothetical protein
MTRRLHPDREELVEARVKDLLGRMTLRDRSIDRALVKMCPAIALTTRASIDRRAYFMTDDYSEGEVWI